MFSKCCVREGQLCYINKFKINLNMQGNMQENKKGEVQFLKMTRFDVQTNVERKQKENVKFNF